MFGWHARFRRLERQEWPDESSDARRPRDQAHGNAEAGGRGEGGSCKLWDGRSLMGVWDRIFAYWLVLPPKSRLGIFALWKTHDAGRLLFSKILAIEPRAPYAMKASVNPRKTTPASLSPRWRLSFSVGSRVKVSYKVREFANNTTTNNAKKF